MGRASAPQLDAQARAIHATRAGLATLIEGARRSGEGDAREALVLTLLGLASVGLLAARGRVDARAVESARSWRALVDAFEGCAHDSASALLERAARRQAALDVPSPTVRALLASAGPGAWAEVDAEGLGAAYEQLVGVSVREDASGALSLAWTDARRRSGSHYTPRAIADRVAMRTLAPLVARRRAPDLRIGDPACGGGAMLLAAARALAASSDEPIERLAAQCLRGVDLDPIAVAIARDAIHVETGARLPASDFASGDALDDASLDWRSAFRDVFSREGAEGFDAFVGNPPWVSFVGRAAQPLAAPARARLSAQYGAFRGYLNLQGVFVERCARLLAPGGRLGLLLPSSMSEQAGYAPTRRAHDALAACDPSLPDFGDAFDGVFQPCMALLSTRRAAPEDAPPAPWPMERDDLDAVALGMLAKLRGAPLPPETFGERGLQTTAARRCHLSPSATARHRVAIRSGSDIGPFVARPAGQYADRAGLGRALRDDAQFAAVRVLIRQTARFPIACLSDGLPFRNSLLAGFETAELPAPALVAYLNASPIRWLHHTTTRDARQGMPQLKIGHLRALPAPPTREVVSKLRAVGERLCARGEPPTAADQRELDEIVADAFGLDAVERAAIDAWTRRTR